MTEREQDRSNKLTPGCYMCVRGIVPGVGFLIASETRFFSQNLQKGSGAGKDLVMSRS